MVVIYAGATALGLSTIAIVAVLCGYVALAGLYEVYAARFNQRERAAKRRARRTDSGLYGWPLGGVEDVAAPTSAVTVRSRPVTVAPSVRTRVEVETEPAGVAASDDAGWPESAPVVEDDVAVEPE